MTRYYILYTVYEKQTQIDKYTNILYIIENIVNYDLPI